MNFPWKKFLSGSTAAILIVWACFTGGTLAGVLMSVFEITGLMLIWNSGDLGSPALTGFITSPTPAWLVFIGGWVVLFIPIIILWLGSSR